MDSARIDLPLVGFIVIKTQYNHTKENWKMNLSYCVLSKYRYLWSPILVSSWGLRSSGCWMSSESLSWQTLNPILLGGPTLTDTQVFSMRHLFLQSLSGLIPMDKYICLKTCCCRACPSIGFSNMRLRLWIPATDWVEIWWQACWTFFASNSITNSWTFLFHVKSAMV